LQKTGGKIQRFARFAKTRGNHGKKDVKPKKEKKRETPSYEKMGSDDPEGKRKPETIKSSPYGI